MNLSQTLPSLYIIRASAGAGKTFELATYFLKILASFSQPSATNLRRILAITFTNKAADEMRERILKFLKEIALDTSLGRYLQKETSLQPEQAQKWMDVILDHYSDFNVKTIDSLLFTIFKGLGFELNLSPELEVYFDLKPILDEAFERFFRLGLEQYPEKIRQFINGCLQVEEVKGVYPENKLKSTLSELYLQVIGRVKEVKFDFRKYQEARQQVQDNYKQFFSCYQKLLDHINKNKLKKLNQDLEPESIIKRSFFNQTWDQLFKKNTLSQIDQADLEQFQTSFNQLKAAVSKFKQLLGKRAYYKVSSYSWALNQFSQTIDDLGQRDGFTLSKVWTEKINQFLKGSLGLPLIYAYLGDKIHYFLIDEFQDTARRQWEGMFPLIEEAIANGGSLLVFGDVKQAIYRWRGGDWTLFWELPQMFPNVTPSEIKQRKLPCNFRSHPKLVDFFNQLFAPLADQSWIEQELAPCLGQDCSEQVKNKFVKDIKTSYQDSEQKAARKVDSDEATILFYSISGSREEIQAKVQKHLVNQVKTLWQQDHRDIAILVRKNEQAKEVSSWLFEQGLPVITENSLTLWNSSLILGIVNFISLLIDPEDQIAWYGLLRSGLLDNSPQTEQDLLYAVFNQNQQYQLWQKQIQKALRSLSQATNYLSAYELIMGIGQEFNLESRFQHELSEHKIFWERFLELIYETERKKRLHLEDLRYFLQNGGLEAQVGLSETISAINVMTIHKAKGLEFEHVFLPYTDFWFQSKPKIAIHDQEVVYLSKEAAQYKPEVSVLIDENKANDFIELINLFYVATTRAKKDLYCYLWDISTNQRKTFAEVISRLLTQSKLTGYLKEIK